MVRKDSSSPWAKVQEGMVVTQTAEIKTGKGANAKISIDENAQTAKLEVKESSLLRPTLLQTDPKTGEKITLIDVAVGEVLVMVEKLKGDSQFVVRTPSTTTAVRGTIFDVIVR